jgi:hypothetical protein
MVPIFVPMNDTQTDSECSARREEFLRKASAYGWQIVSNSSDGVQLLRKLPLARSLFFWISLATVPLGVGLWLLPVYCLCHIASSPELLFISAREIESDSVSAYSRIQSRIE